MIKTYLKARCKKTGKYFAFEVRKEFEKPAKITNFYDIDEEQANHLNPEYRVDENIEVDNNLKPCRYCKTRRIGKCSHIKNKKTCKINDRFDYYCLFCDELEIDYSRSEVKDDSFYNKVNLSNLPPSAFDRHGNPQGDQFDLAKDGSMKGFSIIILDFGSAGSTRKKLKKSLEVKGFTVFYYGKDLLPTPNTLKEKLIKPKTQLWIISGGQINPSFKSKYLPIVLDYFTSGGNLYLWGDNAPLFVEANIVLQELFKTDMYGSVPGDRIISIKKNSNISGIVASHPIATGIINFHEGESIATIKIDPSNQNSNSLSPLVYGSDGTIISAYYQNAKSRLIADGGFTRLSQGNIDKAGTLRFVLNSAIWLAYIEKYGLSDAALPLLK